jgi:hypothetical protein
MSPKKTQHLSRMPTLPTNAMKKKETAFAGFCEAIAF